MSDIRKTCNIGVIVLAAGGSSRLGQPKQLLKFRDKPLLQHILNQTQAFVFAVRVLVLGAHASEIKREIDPGNFKVIINDNWKEGIAASVRAGVTYSLETVPDLEHILFLLSDQPFVTNELIKKLAESHQTQGNGITASKYEDAVGVPAIFSKKFFRELRMLEGDRGAKVLMDKYPEKLATVPFSQGSIDLDKPEDYHKLVNL